MIVNTKKLPSPMPINVWMFEQIFMAQQASCYTVRTKFFDYARLPKAEGSTLGDYRQYTRARERYLDYLERYPNLKTYLINHPENSLIGETTTKQGQMALLDRLVEKFFIELYDLDLNPPPATEDKYIKLVEPRLSDFLKSKGIDKFGSIKEFVGIFRAFLQIVNKLELHGYSKFVEKCKSKIADRYQTLEERATMVKVSDPEPTLVKESVFFTGTIPAPVYLVEMPKGMRDSQIARRMCSRAVYDQTPYMWLDLKKHPDFNLKQDRDYLLFFCLQSLRDKQLRTDLEGTAGFRRENIPETTFKAFVERTPIKTHPERSPIIETKNSATQSGHGPCTF